MFSSRVKFCTKLRKVISVSATSSIADHLARAMALSFAEGISPLIMADSASILTHFSWLRTWLAGQQKITDIQIKK